MANEEQLSILKQGVDVWNKWREENPDIEIDLSGAWAPRLNLSSEENNFQGLNLRKANCRQIYFMKANLTGADFSQADLSWAKLHAADLHRACFHNAILIGTYFEVANICLADLTGVNLKLATFGETHLGEIDLSEVQGLDEARHANLSYLSIDTIHKSKGRIPVSFLRGCGLSELDIEYAKLANPNLDPEQVTDITYKINQLYVGGCVQYYSCFISYSSKDHEFAQQLHDDLQNNGVRCWFDREDLKIGDTIRPTIDRQIRLKDKLLVILSENSIKSEWVGDEVEGALEQEQKGSRSVLFPIRLDDTVLNTCDDWAAKIKRRRHIGDFSNWKDESSYQKAFERLLRDLKATG